MTTNALQITVAVTTNVLILVAAIGARVELASTYNLIVILAPVKAHFTSALVLIPEI